MPDVIRIIYHENGDMKNFIIPGWLDKETLQGPDVIQIFCTLKQKYTTEEFNKWIRDLPVFIQDIHWFGYVHESTFERLGYSEDRDGFGDM